MLETLKATLEQLQSMGEMISDATIRRIKTAIEEAQYDWDEEG
jgi:anti-sigma28 factor (negative regulator of flagellin synthesis)